MRNEIKYRDEMKMKGTNKNGRTSASTAATSTGAMGNFILRQ
jgi:hypothetical protein